MANFGLNDLRVVNPYDIAFREAVSAVGGAHVLKSARVFGSVGDAVADCSLVVGTTAAQKRELQQPLERLDTGMPQLREHPGAGGAPVRVREVRAVERRSELLPQPASHPDSAGDSVDESGTGGGGLPVRVRAPGAGPAAPHRAHGTPLTALMRNT